MENPNPTIENTPQVALDESSSSSSIQLQNWTECENTPQVALDESSSSSSIQLQNWTECENTPQVALDESSSSSSIQLQNWTETQNLLKRKLIAEDDFKWAIPRTRNTGSRVSILEEEKEGEGEVLKYVGGVDISFSKEDPSVACGILLVLDLHTLQVVYEDSSLVTLNVPYVPGFLAFREVPVLLELLKRMKNQNSPFYPQVLMVDGNGILHPRGFGLACHLGVLANLPTIGIGKNLHHVDGLTLSGVNQLLKDKENSAEGFITLRGFSGCIWGVAMNTGESRKPIFISVGHRISLYTAIQIVKGTCKYRVPEPIRQADIRSRDHIRKHQSGAL